MLEKDIEGRVRAWAVKHGFLVVKVRFAEVGYPDRLFISPKGHTIFIEFKRPGEQPEQIQLYRLRQLQSRNIPAYWSDNYVGAVNILKAALEPEELPEKSNPSPVVTGIRRAISGPRAGQDVDGPRYPQDSEDERSDEKGSDRGPTPANDEDVARRD